jgi:hypothetical protein
LRIQFPYQSKRKFEFFKKSKLFRLGYIAMETENPGKKVPENDLNTKGIKCCFAQINDLASSINIKEINTETSKYKYESKQSKEAKSQNCTCYKTVSRSLKN